MNYLNLQLPGLVKEISVFVTFQFNGIDWGCLSLQECVDQWKKHGQPQIGPHQLDPFIVLPGLIFKYVNYSNDFNNRILFNNI